jgi:hypothetical protein
MFQTGRHETIVSDGTANSNQLRAVAAVLGGHVPVPKLKAFCLLTIESQAVEGVGSGHLDGQQILVANWEWRCGDGDPVGRRKSGCRLQDES